MSGLSKRDKEGTLSLLDKGKFKITEIDDSSMDSFSLYSGKEKDTKKNFEFSSDKILYDSKF